MLELIPKVIEVARVEWGTDILIALIPQPLRYTRLLHVLSASTDSTVHSSTFDNNLKKLKLLRLLTHDTLYRLTDEGEQVAILLRDARAHTQRQDQETSVGQP